MQDFSLELPLKADFSQKIESIQYDGVTLFNGMSESELGSLSRLWRQNDYLVLHNAITKEAIELLDKKITFNQLESVDDARQFFRVHNDHSARQFIYEFLKACQPFYEMILSLDLLPSYGFAMKYIKNSDMDPHYDNLVTPISSTVCYRFTPTNVSNALYLDKARFFNPYTQRLTVKDRDGIPPTNVVEMDLKPGDLAVFRGRTHLHWRKFIETEMDYRALLLHYMDFKYRNELRTGCKIPHVEDILVDVYNYDEFRKTYAMYFEGGGENWI